MSKHIGYIAAKPADVAALVHAPAQAGSVEVYPSIVSAWAALSNDPGSSVYEVTVTLQAGESFSAGTTYSSDRFDTFLDAYNHGAAMNGGVTIETRSEGEISLRERITVGPQVSIVGW